MPSLSIDQNSFDLPHACESIYRRFRATRRKTEALCEPLATEDYVIQSMPDVSPPKWHLAHTSWFFEKMVLEKYYPDYRPFDPRYAYLFNSYYHAAGRFFDRPRRGTLSRPTVKDIYEYRNWVDSHLLELLDSPAAIRMAFRDREFIHLIRIGIEHEQQHQELLLTDIKHIFAANPLRPRYQRQLAVAENSFPHRIRPHWIDFPKTRAWMGEDPETTDFAYDNEMPRHEVILAPYALASQPVTCGEFLEFMEDGGYDDPLLWLSDGWDWLQREKICAPLYWEKIDGKYWLMTLSGMRTLREEEPVCHVSNYEAQAYAKWRGARLPSEYEWEHAARQTISSNRISPSADFNFADRGSYHPEPATHAAEPTLQQMFGDVWEWTQSAYTPYPGFRPFGGPLGEYNGKFMCNQMVLRGGSCATPARHIRASYRNYFAPSARWQFAGFRLAVSTES